MKKQQIKAGFTLIEVLVATSILVTVGVAVIVLEKQFIGSGSTNKHRMEATALATEGINMVKQVYTTNLINPANAGSSDLWLNLGANAGTKPQTGGQNYYLDTSNHLQQCDAICANGQVTQNGTTYTRTIQFNSIQEQ